MKKKLNGIVVKGASEHNLKNIDAFIPHQKITVVTGLSGSGKSSLVFDTIYGEAHRRYMDSLSSSSRYFMDQMKKPKVDTISGLSPPIAISQKSINTSPRSTVGTLTEVYDLLRLLFAKLGTPHCPEHHIPLTGNSLNQITKEVMKLKAGTKFSILSPVARDKKGGFAKEIASYLSSGFSRARVDGQWRELAGLTHLAQKKSHNIELLIERLIMRKDLEPYLKTKLNLAALMSGGHIIIQMIGASQKTFHYSLNATCPKCLRGFPELDPQIFSFNKPKGACPECNGLGVAFHDSDNGTDAYSVSIQTDDEELLDEEHMEDYQPAPVCPQCQGDKLNPFALSVRILKYNIADLARMSINRLTKCISGFRFSPFQKKIADKILGKLLHDLKALSQIGLDYLSLDRPVKSLSGGEAQRLRLVSGLSSPLVGALYVLDEPSIGLHPRDHDRLLNILFQIRDRGNTVLVVEHDEKTIRSADYIVDLGPGSGHIRGGRLVSQGTLKSLVRSLPISLTGAYLSGQKTISIPKKKSPSSKRHLKIIGAYKNNLKNLNVDFPLSCLIGVSGVSGSGKSSLIIDTLYKTLATHIYSNSYRAGKNKKKPVFSTCRKIEGMDFIKKVICVNQKPIGRTPRSIPATYTGILSTIRMLLSQTPQAKIQGFSPGDFSFNIKGGRCEPCKGSGYIKQEMFFLSPTTLVCDICEGRRYSPAVLEIKYRDKNIDDILNLDILSALKFFSNHSVIQNKLETLAEVGLGYLTLGQSSTTLSGGEAQRIKLSKELSKKNMEQCLYILDEPTTGLHFADIDLLLKTLRKLIDKGSTVIVIEHNMDVIKSCDYVIDLGPGGGDLGGRVVVAGSPEKITKSARSVTSPFLKKALRYQD